MKIIEIVLNKDIFYQLKYLMVVSDRWGYLLRLTIWTLMWFYGVMKREQWLTGWRMNWICSLLILRRWSRYCFLLRFKAVDDNQWVQEREQHKDGVPIRSEFTVLFDELFFLHTHTIVSVWHSEFFTLLFFSLFNYNNQWNTKTRDKLIYPKEEVLQRFEVFLS